MAKETNMVVNDDNRSFDCGACGTHYDSMKVYDLYFDNDTTASDALDETTFVGGYCVRCGAKMIKLIK